MPLDNRELTAGTTLVARYKKQAVGFSMLTFSLLLVSVPATETLPHTARTAHKRAGRRLGISPTGIVTNPLAVPAPGHPGGSVCRVAGVAGPGDSRRGDDVGQLQ